MIFDGTTGAKVAILVVFATIASQASAADQRSIGAVPGPTSQPFVTWDEYQRVVREQQEMRHEMAEMKKQIAAQSALSAAASPQSAANSDAPTNAELEEEMKVLKDIAERNKGGLEGLVIAGDAHVDFVAQHGSPSTFGVGVSPLFLWQPSDRFLFETAFDVNVATDSSNNSGTTFDLTIADASFIINDYLIVGGGLFVAPFGQYHNHFDPPWINKFPDDPLPFTDPSLAPSSIVGVFAKGAVPISTMKVTYDVYASNGPNLRTGSGADAGQLNFSDYTDLNNNKAIGGRVGFLPIDNLEMGYSAMAAEVNPAGFRTVNALLQAVDISYHRVVDPLGGTFDFRAEWIFSNVDRATYDAHGSLKFGPLSFPNNRNGGYVQLAFRPTRSEIKFIRDLEFVTRFDRTDVPLSAPGGDRENRFTIGLDYWITPSVALKSAYEFDDKKVGDGNNAFLVQLGIGL